MKFIQLVSFLSIYSFQVHAQQPEPLILAVDYSFTHVHDTTNRSHPLKENMTLYVAANSSSYRRTQPPIVPSPSSANAGAQPAVTRVVQGRAMAVVYAPGFSYMELLQYPTKDKLITCSKIGITTFVVTDTLPNINWQIGQQIKMIGEYTCQQATGTYAGRKYTAWFTTAIPFRYGPWKLSGLPGLILEAGDESGEIQFAFRNIRKGQPDELHRSDRDKLISTNQQAWIKAKEAFEENPVGAMQAQLPSGGSTPMLCYRDIDDHFTMGAEAQQLIDQKRKSASTFINNPIERK